MLLSHILLSWGKELESERLQTLFGDPRRVPDIPTLQARLETAWAAGFDPEGAAQLGHSVRATKTWIGTTEVASLLRHARIKASIADFGTGAGRGVHAGLACDACGVSPIVGVRHASLALHDYDLCDACHRLQVDGPAGPFQAIQPAADSGHAGRCLASWVMRYFSTGSAHEAATEGSGLVTTGRGPLYFQYQGHSCTIIGIHRDAQGALSLLVLNPSWSASKVQSMVRVPGGWMEDMLLPVNGLRQLQYQVLCLQPGLATDVETEQGKTIEAAWAYA